MDGTFHALCYNAQGQLALKTAASKPIQFIYDEAGHLLAEHADPATQSPTQDHIWLGDTPIAVVRPNSTDPSKPLVYHVYADHLNTPRAIYDAFNKRLVWRWESEAFGNTLPDQDADKNGSQFVYNLRFPGQYWDNSIKLSHNWFRTYNPDTGQYVQSDPIGLDGGLNTFGYVYGKPNRYIDPTGLETCVLVTRIWGILGVADHAALYTSRGSDAGGAWIYDPSGSYARSVDKGNGDLIQGDAASITKFASFYKKLDGSKTNYTCKNTTEEEEKRLFERALEEGGKTGPQCARSVSNVLSGSEYFPGVEPGTFWPGRLFNAARQLPNVNKKQ